MVEAIKILVIAVFGICVYVMFENTFMLLGDRITAKSRLTYRRGKTNIKEWITLLQERSKIFKHIYLLLEVLEFKISLSFYLFSTLILSATGILIGAYVFHSFLYTIAFLVILGSIPYIYVRWKILGYQNNVSKDLISAFEAFLEAYYMVPTHNMRSVLSLVIPEIRYPVRYAFEQLQMMLNTQKDLEYAAMIFKIKIGGKWATDFINIFEVGYTTGIDMSASLVELIEDMRDHEEEIEEDRKRDVEIRWGNILSVFIFGLFLYLAMKFNPNWYYYYFQDGFGKTFTFTLMIGLFFMFLIGIYMSRKRH